MDLESEIEADTRVQEDASVRMMMGMMYVKGRARRTKSSLAGRGAKSVDRGWIPPRVSRPAIKTQASS
jgi:hypothetical protein